MKIAETGRDSRPGKTGFAVVICLLTLVMAGRTASVRAGVDPADITYVPERSELAGSTQYIFVDSSGDVSTALSSPNYSYSLHTQVISQTFAYGFTNALSLSLGFVHDHVDASYKFASAPGASAEVSGNRANFSLNYRLVELLPEPLNIDLSAGNTGASVAISHEGSLFSVLARAGVYHARGGTGLDPVLNADLTSPETWGYLTELHSQFRLTQRWSVDLGATYISAPFSGEDASIAGNSFRLERAGALTLNSAVVFQVVPTRLSVRLGYQHSFIGRRRDAYADATHDVFARNQRADTLGLALVYQF